MPCYQRYSFTESEWRIRVRPKASNLVNIIMTLLIYESKRCSMSSRVYCTWHRYFQFSWPHLPLISSDVIINADLFLSHLHTTGWFSFLVMITLDTASVWTYIRNQEQNGFHSIRLTSRTSSAPAISFFRLARTVRVSIIAFATLNTHETY